MSGVDQDALSSWSRFDEGTEARPFASSEDANAANGAIQVALVGGAQLYRTALRLLVQSDPDIQIVAESKSTGETFPHSGKRTDVVLLDIDDGLTNPLGMLEQTQSFVNGAAILVLADGVEHGVTDPLLIAGARGVLRKDAAAANHLLSAIRKVHKGELWVDRATASRLILGFCDRRRVTVGKSERGRIESLSRREREVVAFVADGLCNKAIAKKMGISDNTVRHHLTSIYAKLETRDRLELVIYAFRHSVVTARH